MKKITSLVLAVVMLATMLSVFAVPASAAPNDTQNITVESGKISEFTGSQNAGSVTVYGTMIIKENAVFQMRYVKIEKSGKLIIEKGAILTMTGGYIWCEGALAINGKLNGKSDQLTLSEDFSIGDIGAISGLAFLGKPSGYASSVVQELKRFDCSAINIKDTVYAFANSHKHTYQNGVCVNCGVSGCVLGENNHTYQNYVCTVCGAIDPAHPHSYENSICTICKYKCVHILFDEDTYKCVNCGAFQCDVNGHTFDGGKCTLCNICQCEIKGHSYRNGKCTVCGETCKNEFHNGKYVCPDCGMSFNATATGSVLSEGSLTIICTVAAAVIFGLGGFLLGKKKKKPEDEIHNS